jgi:hypothetical protein
MFQKVLLVVILLTAIAVIVRAVLRSIASVRDEKPPSCAGCPFDSACEMQHKRHTTTPGSDNGE